MTRGTTHQSLTHDEARDRQRLLRVASYDVALDLTGPETFPSRSTIRFTSGAGTTFLDVQPVRLDRVTLDGAGLDPARLASGRFPLELTEGEHELVVEALMRFRSDGEGLHLHVDPADGRRYVYGMSFMEAAPSWFGCFDQPDLKAPYTLHVRAPLDWTVLGNAPGEQVERGVWEFAQTAPLSTYFVTLVAGPYHVLRDEHDGIPLGLSARQSLAADLDREADELLTMTRQCFDEYHRLFGIRYPFGAYHQAFVPEFNAGAMENPGCVTFRDPLVFSSRVTRGERIKRATTVAHEMAHQWFGNLTTPVWWDDLWLNESFAEYMGNRVTADVTEYDDAWIHNAYARRQWGLVADQRPSSHPVAGNGAEDAASALQDFDGISYVKGCSILRQLNATLGDEVFLGGVVDHLTRARFGNATMTDLVGSWERALRDASSPSRRAWRSSSGRRLGSSGTTGADDLTSFTRDWLRTTGPDRLQVDRGTGRLLRHSPAEPAARTHRLHVAHTTDGSQWRATPVAVGADGVPVPEEGFLVLDPHEETWALTLPDPVTLAALPELFPASQDAPIRAAMWNMVRSAHHNALVAPQHVVETACAWLPTEGVDDAVGYTVPWLVRRVLPLTLDPFDAARRLHDAAATRLAGTTPGSTLQLAFAQATILTSEDVGELQAWSRGEGLPPGLPLDLDLRWRVLVRLAALGAVDRDRLDDELATEPTARAVVEHVRAVASLPDADAKAWAWAHFTGERPAANYEVEAAGLGLWQPDQPGFTDEYVDRYFAELPGAVDVHAGWLLGDVTKDFFPATVLTPEVLARAETLLAADHLDAAIRRNLLDATDDLRRQLAVRTAYPVG